jgi:hypothetical protein
MEVKCGATTVEYDEKQCTYTCLCSPGSPCAWSVTCPGPGGKDITTSGTGLVSTVSGHPSVVISGALAVVAKSLEKAWGRRVIVPGALQGKRVRRRMLKGTPEKIAQALGFSLGAKRMAAVRRAR